jgi:hypothetical protein
LRNWEETVLQKKVVERKQCSEKESRDSRETKTAEMGDSEILPGETSETME